MAGKPKMKKGRTLPESQGAVCGCSPDWKRGRVARGNDIIFLDVSLTRVVMGEGYVTVTLDPEFVREMLAVVPMEGIIAPSNSEPRREYEVTIRRARLVYERGLLVMVACHVGALREFLRDRAEGRA